MVDRLRSAKLSNVSPVVVAAAASAAAAVTAAAVAAVVTAALAPAAVATAARCAIDGPTSPAVRRRLAVVSMAVAAPKLPGPLDGTKVRPTGRVASAITN